MRKQQEKLLKRAEKRLMSTLQITLLSREDLTIQELQVVMNYFVYQPEDTDKDTLAVEADRCISYLKHNRGKIKDASVYKILLNAFLHSDVSNGDSLIGTKKKPRLFKMYYYLATYKNWNSRNYEGIDLFWSYAFMLYRNFSLWQINTILRPMISDEERRCSLEWTFTNYPCLMDDYLHNGKDAFLYYLAVENNFLPYFYPDKKTLDKLYDHDTHKFLFANEEFSDYFIRKENAYGYSYVVNITYLTEKLKVRYPIISLIGNFCKENGLKPYDENKDIFTTWQTWKLMNPQEEEKLKECYKLLGQGFTTDIKAFYLAVTISSNFFTTVTYTEYRSIYVGADNDNGWKVGGTISSRVSFMISPDGRLFQKLGKTANKQKYVPLKMKSFAELYMLQNTCGNLMSLLLAYHAGRNPFYKDVIKDYISTHPAMPLFFNEVADYHNRSELIRKKYKTSLMLPVKWNKQNLNLSYLLIKAYGIVDPGKSRQILIQQKDMYPVNVGNYNGRAVYRSYEYVKQLLCKNVLENEVKRLATISMIDREELIKKYRSEIVEEIKTDVLSDEYEQWIEERVEAELLGSNDIKRDVKRIVNDYVKMCRQAKIKIRLNIYSVKQLEKLHGRIANNPVDYRKMTQEVNVPENSKFQKLRDILPPEFEWIKTRKRLILETELQHHCVWSYAPKITNDVCAIYSFTDIRADYTNDGVSKRYTIEFMQRKDGSYYVEQVQGKYDKVNAHGMREYIQLLLIQYNKLG